MPRNSAKVFISFACLSFSLTSFADVPFTDKELATIRDHMYHNIAHENDLLIKVDGDHVIKQRRGAILASPSNKGQGFSQDYQFHWTRDAAITIRQIISDKYKTDYPSDYYAFEKVAQQQISNPGEETLGQPKFNIDGTVWEGQWGRPQNDGPAIRALAICEMTRGREDWAQDSVPMIKTDLDYVIREWRNPSFDLWEEVKDTDHFFTKMMQRQALTCGGNLLYFTDHPASQRYTDTARDITQSLDRHWNESLGYITETVDQLNYKGGGLNSAALLAVLYSNNIDEARDLPKWSVLDERVMSTVAKLREVFAKEYPINNDSSSERPLIGRYPNDKYDGNLFQQGNPWILASAAMAEYYYSLAYVYQNTHLPITLTELNKRFWSHVHSIVAPIGTVFHYDTPAYNLILLGLVAEGDAYLAAIKKYQVCEYDSCLHFAEQIDAKTGKQTSAKDLTWSYVSILRAMQVREKISDKYRRNV